ncbi:MAG: Smr/MutS family protein [Lentisphaeria bacterium]|nr:Smr/MutS family protein [Lentisphaeria bacterium]
MNQHSYEVLELPKTLEIIAEYCLSNSAKDRLLVAHPGNKIPTKLQKIIKELTQILAEGLPVYPGYFENSLDILERVKPEGAILDLPELVVIQKQLNAAQNLKKQLKIYTSEKFPALNEFIEKQPILLPLADHLTKILDEDGTLKNNASIQLAQIRKDIHSLETQIKNKLNRILHANSSVDVVQEHQIVIRNGRYVIPVIRANHKRIPGVIHDQSNSGQTVFIEPSSTLQEGNNLATAKIEEKREIRRILAIVSDEIRNHWQGLKFLNLWLKDYDVCRGISRWSHEFNADYLYRHQGLELINARHPILLQQFKQEKKSEKLVPLNVKLETQTAGLVISGANAGGKTVSLKTIGLLTLMSLTGLPITCEPGSSIPKVQKVLADIGDEQSIAENLSTYSSHIRQLKSTLLNAKQSKCLILLDELGTGTDPVEGAAIACATLKGLLESKATVIATTHLSDVKQYAHDHEKMENACVVFDDVQLEPTFQLLTGQPGASHAMDIAKRMGMPKEVLEHAASLMDSEKIAVEQLLAKMNEDNRNLQYNLKHSQRSLKQAEEKHKKVKEELEALRKDRRKLLHKAQAEAAAIVENTRQEMNRLLKSAGKENKDKESLRSKLHDKNKKLNRGLAQTQAKPATPLKAEELAVGDLVWVERMSEHGKITKLFPDKKRAMIDINQLSVEVKVKDLGKASEQALKKQKGKQIKVRKPTVSRLVRTELDLHGMRVEEALQEVDSFLNDAILANLPRLRIVHGYGTGALRVAVHQYLKESPIVNHFALGKPGIDPGGDGVTWVDL